MPTIAVQIARLTDAAQPGWVECVLRDASNREWRFIDKVPVFTTASLDASSSYPQPGVIACEILREWTGEDGRRRCLIDTSRPWGVSAVDGETRFEVVSDEVKPHSA